MNPKANSISLSLSPNSPPPSYTGGAAGDSCVAPSDTRPAEYAPSRETPYLCERSGRYYFVRRFPRIYLDRGIFKQPTYRKSLGTTDRLLAELKASALSTRFDRLMQWLEKRDIRHGAAPVLRSTAEVNADDVGPIAQRFAALLLHSDDLDRQQRLNSEELGNYIADVEAQRAQVRDANRHGDFETSADEVRGFLAAEQLTCDEGTDTWRNLLKAMTQAQLKALRAILQRLDGDEPAATPEPHPPIRCEDDFDDLDCGFRHWLTKNRPATKTVIEARSIFVRLKAFTGKTRLSTLNQAEIVKFQASERARLVNKKRVRPQTVNKLLGLLSAIFTLACDDVLTSRGIANPFETMHKEKVKSSDIIDKQDLSSEELEQLFSGPVHSEGFRPKGGAGEAAYWLPILGHSTGARMKELAQLSVSEVVVRDGVTCLWLTNRNEAELESIDALTEKERARLFENSMKTGESRRVIPVHPEVLALGFMDYVKFVRDSGSRVLFPALKADCHGNIAGNFSKWYNGYLKKVKIKVRGLDWISFRHTYKTYTREAEISDDKADYLEGHAADRNSKKYGRFQPRTLLASVRTLSFPALKNLPHWRVPAEDARNCA